MNRSTISFGELYFTDADLDRPLVTGDTLTGHVRNMGLTPRHPLNETGRLLTIPKCALLFRGVRQSVRRIFEYIGDPNNGIFKPPVLESDGPFPKSDGGMMQVAFEGRLTCPLAWIDE